MSFTSGFHILLLLDVNIPPTKIGRM